jgi:hypothetical protein
MYFYIYVMGLVLIILKIFLYAFTNQGEHYPGGSIILPFELVEFHSYSSIQKLFIHEYSPFGEVIQYIVQIPMGFFLFSVCIKENTTQEF